MIFASGAPADSASSLPPTPKTLPAVLNRMTYHARLALARAFNREEAKDETEAEKYYQEVMVMAPEVLIVDFNNSSITLTSQVLL